jgi:hypothetical protein
LGQQRIAALESELGDLTEELQAARAMNRELMTELNRASNAEPPARRQRRPAGR